MPKYDLKLVKLNSNEYTVSTETAVIEGILVEPNVLILKGVSNPEVESYTTTKPYIVSGYSFLGQKAPLEISSTESIHPYVFIPAGTTIPNDPINYPEYQQIYAKLTSPTLTMSGRNTPIAQEINGVIIPKGTFIISKPMESKAEAGNKNGKGHVHGSGCDCTFWSSHAASHAAAQAISQNDDHTHSHEHAPHKCGSNCSEHGNASPTNLTHDHDHGHGHGR